MRKSFITLFLATLTISGLTSCNSHTHSYDVENPVWQWTQYSAATVTFTCSDCDDTTEGHTVTENATITEKETEKATCEEDGYKVFEASATFLEKVYTNSKTQTLPKLGHTEDTSIWKKDNTKHWHDCLNCGDDYHFSEDEHTFSDWETTKDADHYNEGNRQRYCTVCSYTENEPISKTKYTYDEVKAIHDNFATFESTKSYYISHVAEELDYAIKNIEDTAKTEHEDELNTWAASAKEACDYFNENFTVVFDAEAVDTYQDVVTKEEFYSNKGTVLKVNADNSITGEHWTFGTDRLIEFDDDVKTLVFAVYNSYPMDLRITNTACNKEYKPVSTGTWKGGEAGPTACSGGVWTEFQINIDDLEKQGFDSLYIALYLMNSPYDEAHRYGIPTENDSATYGSGYITEIIGIKTEYYKPQAQGVIDKINSLSSLDKTNLTLWNGGQILEARSKYNALPAVVQSLVTNLSTLEEYETAYAAIGTAYSYSWGDGGTSSGTIFTASNGCDAQYGSYTEFNNIDPGTTGWVPHFSPIGDAQITGSVKFALYNPQQVVVSLVLLGNDWGSAVNTTAAPGWNEFELSTGQFTGGVVSGFSCALANNYVSTAGFKLSGIYAAK